MEYNIEFRLCMDEESAQLVATGTPQQCLEILQEFIPQNENEISFPSMDFTLKKTLYRSLFARLECPSNQDHSLTKICLSALRILSREKPVLEEIITEHYIDIILKVAGLIESPQHQRCTNEEKLEGLKVMFNMMFQSASIRIMFISNGILEYLIKSISLDSFKIHPEFTHFTMRIIFILTALCQETGPRIRNEFDGLTSINNILETLARDESPFPDSIAELVCETLKVLYNLIHDIVPNKNDTRVQILEEKDSNHLIKVTQLVNILLTHEAISPEKEEEIQSHSIDLLAAASPDCFQELIPEVSPDSVSSFQHEGHDMTRIEVILLFLEKKLNSTEPRDNGPLNEEISPVLSVLVRMAGSVRIIRKYLKSRVLPPLRRRDVLEPPEIGTTLRNKLCALMTSPSGHVTELVSTFLFVLVKENVQRFIKYTGFGNAAGLLTNRGLLAGGKAPPGIYSSDSEDSDTEEYKELSHLIDGMGYIRPDHPPPCEGMTEEQKEFEAMKLVDAIDRLHRQQLIQPAQIGPDGRAVPMDHVCQLLDSTLSADTLIRSQRGNNDTSDSE